MKLVANELLFYIQNKIHSTAKDVIVETCAKFYSLEEVTASMKLLETELNIRLSKRNKSDDLLSKLLNNLYNRLWTLDDTATQIPRFVAADLSRIPQERENSNSLATIEQILSSIHGLKSIVSNLQNQMVTQEQLKASLSQFSSCSWSAEPSTPNGATSAPVLSIPAPSMENLAPPVSSGDASSAPSTSAVRLSPSAPSLSQLDDRHFANVVKIQENKMPRSSRSKQKTDQSKATKRLSSTLIIGKKVSAGVLS